MSMEGQKHKCRLTSSPSLLLASFAFVHYSIVLRAIVFASVHHPIVVRSAVNFVDPFVWHWSFLGFCWKIIELIMIVMWQRLFFDNNEKNTYFFSSSSFSLCLTCKHDFIVECCSHFCRKSFSLCFNWLISLRYFLFSISNLWHESHGCGCNGCSGVCFARLRRPAPKMTH